MSKTGAGQIIADRVIGMLGSNPSGFMIMTAIYFLASFLSQFMSNTAATTLIAPIGLAIAESIGADPSAILMIVAIGAASAFATPVGTPPNTLVLGPGGFNFMDYVKVGTPLIFLSWATFMVVAPIFWPLFP